MGARDADLLPVGFHGPMIRRIIGCVSLHVVFTLPAEIAATALQNKAALYRLLFQAASETMTTIAADYRHLGARIGITAVLHRWGSAMTHHPHIHMIVPVAGCRPMGAAGWHVQDCRTPAGARNCSGFLTGVFGSPFAVSCPSFMIDSARHNAAVWLSSGLEARPVLTGRGGGKMAIGAAIRLGLYAH